MDNNQKNNNNDPKNKQTIMVFLIVALVVLMVMSFFSSMYQESTMKKITYDQFMEMLENKEVKSVYVDSDKIIITPKNQPSQLVEITYYTGIFPDPDLGKKLDSAGAVYESKIPDSRSTILDILIVYVLPLAMVWLMASFILKRMSRGGGMMGVGKSNAKVYVEKQTGVTFKDVAGQNEAKESLQEVVDFLHNPGKYTQIGAKLPKGALLVGPPGTGKTLLAKAVAGEAKVPFFSLSGSDFVEMFVGVGASRVRDLFKQAQQNAPCIIFIDEIDAIGKSRDSRYGGGNDEREQTLNQLLAEMDGFDTSKGILILAATNRPEVLDAALLRPGRFDRRIIVDKPDLKGRVDILKVHAKNVLMDETVDLEAIALATSGAVGSDLANMINEAAINAVKNGRKVVSQSDLFESVEVVIAGKEKKDRILGKDEKRIVAYHEVGHALVTALQKNAEPVQKITIVPRTMGSLGYVMQVPEEEKYLMTKEELKARIVTLFGGRAAEEIIFQSVTTGASNDIEKATKLARAMITQYGMSEKFGLMGLEQVQNQYLDGRTALNCADTTAAEIDSEVMRLLKECYEEARALLTDSKEILDKIAEFLFEKETITGKEFMEIYNKVRGIEPEETSDSESVENSAANTVMNEEVKNEDEVIENGSGITSTEEKSVITRENVVVEISTKSEAFNRETNEANVNEEQEKQNKEEKATTSSGPEFID
jgi:cell division protease FtsH